jgi:hypothetical protein
MPISEKDLKVGNIIIEDIEYHKDINFYPCGSGECGIIIQDAGLLLVSFFNTQRNQTTTWCSKQEIIAFYSIASLENET